MLANWKKRVFPLNRRQAVFAMLLCLVLAVNAVPALRASALYLITDGEATTAVGDEVERACAQSGDRVHSQHQTQQHGENRLPPVEREAPLLPVC